MLPWIQSSSLETEITGCRESGTGTKLFPKIKMSCLEQLRLISWLNEIHLYSYKIFVYSIISMNSEQNFIVKPTTVKRFDETIIIWGESRRLLYTHRAGQERWGEQCETVPESLGRTPHSPMECLQIKLGKFNCDPGQNHILGQFRILMRWCWTRSLHWSVHGGVKDPLLNKTTRMDGMCLLALYVLL